MFNEVYCSLVVLFSQHEVVRVRACHLTANIPGNVHLSPLLLVTIVTSGTSGENDE